MIGVCAGGQDALTDRLGNLATAAGIALDRIERGVGDLIEMRAILRRSVDGMAGLTAEIKPCAECCGCAKEESRW